MHEEQPRLLRQHVAVKRCYPNPVVAQCLHDRIRFLAQEHEISGDCSFAAPSRLEINGGPCPPGLRAEKTIFYVCSSPRHATTRTSPPSLPPSRQGFPRSPLVPAPS